MVAGEFKVILSEESSSIFEFYNLLSIFQDTKHNAHKTVTFIGYCFMKQVV